MVCEYINACTDKLICTYIYIFIHINLYILYATQHSISVAAIKNRGEEASLRRNNQSH